MWSLFENGKELEPLVFSNGKSQEDVVKEVLQAIDQGFKIIFIKGICGTGKSAIALNLARKLGKTSVVVPIKNLQEQYIQDYTDKKYLLRNNEKLKICSIVGRQNFKCKYLNKGKLKPEETVGFLGKEKNAKLHDIFSGKKENHKDTSCDNSFIPCKIEIKEKNLDKIKSFIKQNPNVKFSDFDTLKDVKRMSIAPICPFWSPIAPEEFFLNFKNAEKIPYTGLYNRNFIIHQRKKGCGYYDQYLAYSDADVIIFNSLKYKLESLMDRKPNTKLEVIDECDEFLDSFANIESLNINRLLFSLNMVFSNLKNQKIIDELIKLTNQIKEKYGGCDENKISSIDNTPVGKLLLTILKNQEFLDEVEIDENSYLFHLDKTAKTFENFLDETFFNIEKRERDLFVNLVTTNLEKRFNELLEKNKILVLMSGTIHSENVLKTIFGLENFKIIEAETHHQGELVKHKFGFEMDCKYENFQNKKITREAFLKALSKTVSLAKKPVLIHITSFSDLPTDLEKEKFSINNLPSQQGLIQEQKQDPFGLRIKDFKNGKTDVLFSTKCTRGMDFPGKTCNSIIVTRFPYPNISGIFWKILKKTNPLSFMSFYMDKSHRELLQRIYRGLRSKNDKIHLLSPDIRVLNFDFKGF
jgi:Rad3-related DNA helicase